MPSNVRRPTKPTVFLSHSSTNRRELLALKRLLDERAGGMIEFFLSSDDDSIAHGTIWPAEERTWKTDIEAWMFDTVIPGLYH